MRYAAVLLAVTTVIFGTSVSDPYRWLEDAKSSRTQAWIDVQNARAERVIDAYPNNARIAKRVEELELTGAQQFEPKLRGDTLFYMREIPPQPQPVLVAQHWPSGRPRVVADPAKIGAGTSVDFYWPSPSGRYVAIGTAQGGAESTTIRVIRSDGTQTFNERLGPCGGGTTGPALAWDAGDRGFTYTRLPPDGSQFGIKLYHHVLGTPQSRDTLALGDVSRIAEPEFIASDDGAHAAALVQFGDGSFYRVYVRRQSQWKAVVGPDAGVIDGAFSGPTLLLVATGGSPHGRIVTLRDDGTLHSLVASQNDWAFHSIYPLRSGFLVLKSWGTNWRLDQYGVRGNFVRTVPLPAHGIGIDGVASSSASTQALIAYQGWTGPADRWVSYNAVTGTMKTVFDLRLPSSEYARVRVHTLYAASSDGTRVPVTVLALPGTRQDGTAPAILTGYGGFDISIAPYFIGPELTWLEMGGVYAVANIRGGSEYGEGWHQQGMLTNKQHVFDDFYAAAKALVENRWTAPQRLGIEGGSNGGLLVGATMVQHPQMFGAVVGNAGIYDTLRHHLFPNGAYNVTEYGSVNDPAQFRALYAYSPYHHVKNGVTYPATLLLTSENDPRVASWQSWKFAAALEAATASRRPILMLTHRTGGHGHGASFAQRLGVQAVTLSFMAQELHS
jgi:prolyl oligopeptidase